MKPRLVMLSTLAVVAALCQSRPSLAVQYLNISRSQDFAAFARDYVGDPISTLIQSEVDGPVGFSGSWPMGRLFFGATALRMDATASADSFIEFQVDPFGLDSGYVAIRQRVKTQSCCGSEAYSRVGARGEALTIEFLVGELEGDVELNVQAAWMNSATSQLSLFRGGQGIVTVDNIPRLYEGGEASIRLSPGVHTLTVAKYGFESGPIRSNGETIGHMIANWTFDGVFTGETAGRPHVMLIVPPPVSNDPLEAFPATVAGVQLTFPVLGTDDAFLGLPTAVIDGISKGALITGYEVTSEFAPFISLIVPELPLGGSGLSIDFGSGPQGVVAGQTIDFGPGGIRSFALTGFDPAHASEQRDALVMGLRFAAEGVASILANPVLYQPPGDFDENGFVDGNDFLLWQQQAGSLVAPGTGIDVVADGVIDGQELAVWSAHFGEPSVVAPAGQLVPEPRTPMLIVIIGCGGALRRGPR